MGVLEELCFHRERERQWGPGVLPPAESNTSRTLARRLSDEQRSRSLYRGLSSLLATSSFLRMQASALAANLSLF